MQPTHRFSRPMARGPQGPPENEKALTRMRDLVAAERRSLPWVKIEKDYVFDNRPRAKGRLLNCSAATANSSFITSCGAGISTRAAPAAHWRPITPRGAIVHLSIHDVSYVRVSRAPLEKLQAYGKTHAGWTAKWVSSYGSDFNYDFHVSFSQEQLARARSTITTTWSRASTSCPASACSTRTPTGSSTPTPAARAATKR